MKPKDVGTQQKNSLCKNCQQRRRRKEKRINSGIYCKCGCGAHVLPPHSFVQGHNSKTDGAKKQMSEARFRSSRRVGNHGYVVVTRNGHQVLEHIYVAEQAIGRPLNKGAEVHHINGIRSDNRNSNLVICNDKTYHQLLHRRQRALDECGNANHIKCGYCGKYDTRESMYIRKDKYGYGYHKSCEREYHHKRKADFLRGLESGEKAA